MVDLTPTPNLTQEDLELLDAHAEAVLAELEAFLRAREEQAERGLKALMIAPTLELCRALLRGERVPWNVLRYDQLRRYGLRRRPADGRVDLDDINDVRRP